MLSVSETRDKGKGPYTEISTLLSEYLVIQVQESIKSNNFCCMPRGVEIVKFSTCPGTSKKPKCSCPQKILLVQKNKLANTLCIVLKQFILSKTV